LSTPDAPERAILQGIADLGMTPEGLRVVHGSTVATNAVLEKKGVRTCFITNHGLRDLLTIGRQARRELYNLCPIPEAPPVPVELCLETGGRLSAEGVTLEPLTEDELLTLRQRVLELAPKAVAINHLFSFLDDTAEKAIEAVVPEGMFVSRSSVVLPEYKEYERGMATWLNAYVGPLVQGYLARLEQGVAGAESISVMQSSGGTIAADQAGVHAVHMLLSGPAGGLMGALHVGGQAGFDRLLTIDMGGTSTDVALLDGSVTLTSEGKIGDYPVAVPMVDMHTIGAGGGSIASVDAGGLLCVGPESAGAAPGPACYGQGGDRVAVTDANLMLGHLSAGHFLGGKMTLDKSACLSAMTALAEQMNCDVKQAAAGVIQLANEHMARALRVISVQRGIDPRPYALMSFGGAGGLHVCALAEALNMRTAIVPVSAGVLSALGMLAAPRSRQLSRTLTGPLLDLPLETIESVFSELSEQGGLALKSEGVSESEIQQQWSLDLRYVGQSYTLQVPWTDPVESAGAFHQLHQQRYGHSMKLPVELVTLRVALYGHMPKPELLRLPARQSGKIEPEAVNDDWVSAPVYRRENLLAGDCIVGEALIVETIATTYLAPGWHCAVDDYGNLILRASG
jgi:N-methylhydantoinase A